MALSQEELSSLLTRTSRTFALAIPLLDEPLRTDVGLAYLLFRIADTLEDAPLWGRDQRLLALDGFAGWVVGEDDAADWIDATRRSPPTEDAHCIDLIARADDVRAALAAQGDDVAEAISMDVVRTSTRMAEFVTRQTDEGAIALRDLSDLRAYCYAVAGIVGELLTELFVLRDPALAAQHDALMEFAPAFGEGLQLVNILKDAASDAAEGRVYLPISVERADVLQLARADLVRANTYVSMLAAAGASSYVRAFCELPARLAEATLDRLEQGAPKLGRDEVMQIVAAITRA